MTIAIDIRTGAVVGQVTDAREEWEREQDWLAARGRLTPMVSLLTRDGYMRVPRSSVRLEELR